VIRTPSEDEKKKAKESKDGAVTLAISPHSNPVPSISVSLLLLSSPQVQVVDLGDGGSSESESTESDEATKKASDAEKGPDSSKLVSQAPKNPFSLATKTLTPAKRKMFSIDALGTTSKVIDIDSWLEHTLDRKTKRRDEGAPNKETLSLAIRSGSSNSKSRRPCPFLDKILK